MNLKFSANSRMLVIYLGAEDGQTGNHRLEFKMRYL